MAGYLTCKHNPFPAKIRSPAMQGDLHSLALQSRSHERVDTAHGKPSKWTLVQGKPAAAMSMGRVRGCQGDKRMFLEQRTEMAVLCPRMSGHVVEVPCACRGSVASVFGAETLST